MAEAKAPAPLVARLREARNAAIHLAEASDALTASFNAVETELVQLQLGTAAFVPLERDEADDESTPFLTFRKYDGNWGLFIVQPNDLPDADMWPVTPLVRTSRSLRLRAADKLPVLVEEVVGLTEKNIAQVTVRLHAVNDVLHALHEAKK